MNYRELLYAVATSASLFLPIAIIFLPIMIALSGRDWQAAREKSHARRMAEHRMNARLLRLDI